MRRWYTEIKVWSQKEQRHLKLGFRPVIAPTKEAAQEVLDKYNFHFVTLGDEIIGEVSGSPTDPHWKRMIDYEAIMYN